MSFLETITLVGLVVLIALIWLFMRTRSADLIAEIMEKRRAGSKVVSRAEYCEGLERMDVAVALTDSTFFYENPDLQASFDLAMIDEVEYDDELATGRSVDSGHRALRLRSHGNTFEFIISNADVQKWMAVLPSHRMNDAAQAV